MGIFPVLSWLLLNFVSESSWHRSVHNRMQNDSCVTRSKRQPEEVLQESQRSLFSPNDVSLPSATVLWVKCQTIWIRGSVTGMNNDKNRCWQPGRGPAAWTCSLSPDASTWASFFSIKTYYIFSFQPLNLSLHRYNQTINFSVGNEEEEKQRIPQKIDVQIKRMKMGSFIGHFCICVKQCYKLKK